MSYRSFFQHNPLVIIAGAVFAFVLVACCPYPHYEREAPVFEGKIARQGAAAPNVRVTLSTGFVSPPGCANPKVETRTDASGRYHLDPPQYFLPWIGFGDRHDAWSVCFKFADGLEAVWNGDGYWGGPGFSMLDCEISEAGPTSKILSLGNITAGANPTNGCRVQSFSTAAYTKTREALPKPTR